MNILDAGCGSMARHDPLFPTDVFYLDVEKSGGNRSFVNILADIQFLPFQNDSFELVWCDQVIEHVDNPFLALKELIRISKCRIIVRCPHRLFWKSKSSNPYLRHKHSFNIKWFVKALTMLGLTFEKNFFTKTIYKGFPTDVLSLIRLPVEIEVTIWKK